MTTVPITSLRFLFLRSATSSIRAPQICRAQPFFARSFASRSKKISFSKIQPSTSHKVRSVSRPAKKPTLGPALKVVEPAYFSLEENLGNAGKKTLLYMRHNNGFLFGCYGLCFVSLGWIIYTYKGSIVDQPPDVPGWVSKVYWVGIAMMGCVVLVSGYYPTRIIQRIYAKPVRAVGNLPASVSIILYRRPMLPFLRAKQITIGNPKMITLGRALQPIHRYIEDPKTIALIRAVRPESVEAWTGTEGMGIVKRAGKALGGVPFRFFSSVKRMITTESFVALRISDGGSYVIHQDGWTWKKRGLERLFATSRY